MNTEKEKQLKSIKNMTILALSKIEKVDDVTSILVMLDELREFIDNDKKYNPLDTTEYKFVCFIANKNAPRKPRKKKTNPSTK